MAMVLASLFGGGIDHLLETYGYIIVFGFVAIESLGVPFPGETALIAAGVYAATSHRLGIQLIIVAAAAGAIIGDNIGFVIGHFGGYELVRRYGRYVRFDARRFKVGRYVFMRHGGKVVFFGRFVSILRTYAAFLAGTTRMRWPRFLLFNAAGGIIWSTAYGLASYYAGATLTRLNGTIDIVLGVAGAAAVIAFLFYMRRNLARLEDVADRALPDDPLDVDVATG